jgi:hypothetical protein
MTGSQWSIGISSLMAVGALFQAIATFSSRLALVQLALYVWMMELIAHVLLIAHQTYVALVVTPEAIDQCSGFAVTASLPSMNQLIYLGVFCAVHGIGFKVMLDELRDRNARVLESRRETIQTVFNKGEKDGSGSVEGEEKRNVGCQVEEYEEKEPQTLFDLFKNGRLALKIYFLGELAANWTHIMTTNNSTSSMSPSVSFIFIWAISLLYGDIPFKNINICLPIPMRYD